MVDIDADDRVPSPSWQTCAHRGREGDSFCKGRQVDGFDHCLAHLEPVQLEQVLQQLRPGADLEAPGTNISAELLTRILHAVVNQNRVSEFGNVDLAQAHFTEDATFTGVAFSQEARFSGAQFSGNARFSGAQFSGEVQFDDTQFSGKVQFCGESVMFDDPGAYTESAKFSEGVNFRRAKFSRDAWFSGAQFSGVVQFIGAQFRADAMFDGAQFSGIAWFSLAQFSGNARFHGAHFIEQAVFGGTQFNRDAVFDGTQFIEEALFDSAQFRGNAVFDGAQFSRDARFIDSRFEKATSFGPLAADNLILQQAVFVRPVVLEAVAVSVICTDATWEAGLTMRLRHAQVDLERATFTVASFVTGADQPFGSGYRLLDESEVLNRVRGKRRMPDDPWMPVLLSLRGVDAFNLSVTDVDLSQCRFAGARLLDQLRLEGRCIFDHPPQGLRAGWPLFWRWSSRQSLAEERTWRATTAKYSGWARTGEPAEARPERLAGLYRQLRKAQEDAKNEPGAADFYYGEMEMRRHARTTPAAERTIVWLYWLASGYGLRALRSLIALVILSVIVTTALVGWGLAASTPAQHLTGTVTTTPQSPARIDATLQPTTPRLPSASQRWTRQRTETALRITLESIAFRTTEQPLTPAGTWITIAARILGPLLLFLTLLAVRNRVKR